MTITFDNQPIIYYGLIDLLLYSFVLVILYLLFKNKEVFFEKYKWILFSIIILHLLLFRLPSIFYNTALNPDESWLITGAMTLSKNPIFWKSVDGDTSGPLNFYAITLFNTLFNQPYDFVSARILALILFSTSLFFTFKSINNLYNSKIATLSILPVAFYWGSIKIEDFLFYSSEYLSIAIVSLLLYFTSNVFIHKTKNNFYLFLISFLSIIAPFAKLQIIPITFSICLSIFLSLVFDSKRLLKQKVSNFLFLFGGLVFGISFIFLILYYFEINDLAIQSYIKQNLAYSQTSKSFFDFKNLFESINDNRAEILVFSGILMCINLLLGVFQFKKVNLSKFILINLIYIFSIFSAFKTGFLLHHYLLLLMIPTIFLIADLLEKMSNFNSKAFIFVVITLICMVLIRSTYNPKTNQFITTERTTRPLFQSEIAKEIVKNTRQNEGIAIYGGASHLYLESQRKQGVRYAHTLWGFYDEAVRLKKYENYIEDLEKNKVKIFIDSHTIDVPVLNRKNGGYETIPIIKKYIDSKYTFYKEINQMRIFLRKP